MKIAFIGLGNMGTGIAQCILKSGHDLIVWNCTATKAGPLVALGARAATTAREATAAADVVFTSLMDDKSVLDVVQAGDGVLAGMRPDAVHACVTTISPECAPRGRRSYALCLPYSVAEQGRLRGMDQIGGVSRCARARRQRCDGATLSGASQIRGLRSTTDRNSQGGGRITRFRALRLAL